MKRRFILETMAMMVALLSTDAACANSMAAGAYGMHAKIKTVSFSLRNDMKSEMKVMVGDNEMTLQPGKAVVVKLAIGDRVIAVESNPHYPAGAVLAVK